MNYLWFDQLLKSASPFMDQLRQIGGDVGASSFGGIDMHGNPVMPPPVNLSGLQKQIAGIPVTQGYRAQYAGRQDPLDPRRELIDKYLSYRKVRGSQGLEQEQKKLRALKQRQMEEALRQLRLQPTSPLSQQFQQVTSGAVPDAEEMMRNQSPAVRRMLRAVGRGMGVPETQLGRQGYGNAVAQHLAAQGQPLQPGLVPPVAARPTPAAAAVPPPAAAVVPSSVPKPAPPPTAPPPPPPRPSAVRRPTVVTPPPTAATPAAAVRAVRPRVGGGMGGSLLGMLIGTGVGMGLSHLTQNRAPSQPYQPMFSGTTKEAFWPMLLGSAAISAAPYLIDWFRTPSAPPVAPTPLFQGHARTGTAPQKPQAGAPLPPQGSNPFHYQAVPGMNTQPAQAQQWGQEHGMLPVKNPFSANFHSVFGKESMEKEAFLPALINFARLFGPSAGLAAVRAVKWLMPAARGMGKAMAGKAVAGTPGAMGHMAGLMGGAAKAVPRVAPAMARAAVPPAAASLSGAQKLNAALQARGMQALPEHLAAQVTQAHGPDVVNLLHSTGMNNPLQAHNALMQARPAPPPQGFWSNVGSQTASMAPLMALSMAPSFLPGGGGQQQPEPEHMGKESSLRKRAIFPTMTLANTLAAPENHKSEGLRRGMTTDALIGGSAMGAGMGGMLGGDWLAHRMLPGAGAKATTARKFAPLLGALFGLGTGGTAGYFGARKALGKPSWEIEKKGTFPIGTGVGALMAPSGHRGEGAARGAMYDGSVGLGAGLGSMAGGMLSLPTVMALAHSNHPQAAVILGLLANLAGAGVGGYGGYRLGKSQLKRPSWKEDEEEATEKKSFDLSSITGGLGDMAQGVKHHWAGMDDTSRALTALGGALALGGGINALRPHSDREPEIPFLNPALMAGGLGLAGYGLSNRDPMGMLNKLKNVFAPSAPAAGAGLSPQLMKHPTIGKYMHEGKPQLMKLLRARPEELQADAATLSPADRKQLAGWVGGVQPSTAQLMAGKLMGLDPTAKKQELLKLLQG